MHVSCSRGQKKPSGTPRKNLLELLDYFDVSALCTVLEERLMSIQDVQLAINALRIFNT
jgi:hypothetical protein